MYMPSFLTAFDPWLTFFLILDKKNFTITNNVCDPIIYRIYV